MKRQTNNNSTGIWLALLSWLLFSNLSYASEAETITFGADLPLDSPQPTIIVSKLRAAFAMSGIDFSAIAIPSNRSLSLANQGLVDGDISRVGNLHQITNNKYGNLIKIEHKMLSLWISIFSKNDRIEINKLEDLKDYSVGYMNGRKYFDNVFQPFIRPTHILKVNDDLQAFKVLNKSRIDLVITTQTEGLQLIEHHSEFSGIKEIKKLIELPVYAYIHKKHAPILKQLTENLAKIDKAD